MNVKQVLKRSDTAIGLVHDFKKILRELGRIAKIRRRRKYSEKYLASNGTKKLQLGAGADYIDGWLGTDLFPKSERVLYLDATKPFPFGDNTFDYVYSEHMIEHISWQKALLMLRECRRVLRPGGIIRIATPDLEVLCGLQSHDEDPLKEKYIHWITDKFLTKVQVHKAAFVINNAFRSWGHQFLYDGEMLEMALQEAGFTNIKRCLHGSSDDENLRGIESHAKNVGNEEMVVFETMVYEGKKPFSRQL